MLAQYLTREKLKDFLLLTLGTLCISLGVYFFKFPNNFSTGGVSGISVVLTKYVPTCRRVLWCSSSTLPFCW